MKKLWIMILTLAVAVALIGCGSGTGDGEYAENFASDCERLEQISKEGTAGINEDYLLDWLFHYQIQPDGHGLAITLHPGGLDLSGTTYAVMYETSNGGKNWNLLHDFFTFDRGADAFVYMDEIAVLASVCYKTGSGSMMISYDRGHTWSERMPLDALIDYDCSCCEIAPYIINYNEHTGIITFGWKDSWNREKDEYLLINQFDVNTCQFVEEVYRSPDFPRAS